MPDTAPDRLLVLDDIDCTILLDTRIAERQATIEHNVACRRLARKLAALPPNAQAVAALEKARDDAQADRNAYRATFNARVAAAKVAHAATDLAPTDEGYEPVQGAWKLSFAPLLHGPSPVNLRRKPMSDGEADAFAASYKLSCTAADEAADLERQRVAYLAAHPGLAAGAVPGGEPPPVDPVYEGLVAARDAKAALVRSEEGAQAALVAPYFVGEVAGATYSYARVDIATGDVVFGDNADLVQE